MYVKSYASFLDFYLLKVAILPSFVIYRGSLSRIYLSAPSVTYCTEMTSCYARLTLEWLGRTESVTELAFPASASWFKLNVFGVWSITTYNSMT